MVKALIAFHRLSRKIVASPRDLKDNKRFGPDL
jgi:hypothetical protein